jgi:glycosyltransferase involved in cell wall biosynthesis
VAVISVLVCTRNRSVMLLRLLRSLLATPDGTGGNTSSLEVIVVDQSDGPETSQAVASLGGDGRVRLVRSRSRGKGAALNEGLAVARGEILVCTDDDCEAPAGWAEDMTRALRRQPSAAVLFCQVLPTPGYDQQNGFIPAYSLSRSRTVRSLSFRCRRFGLGAGMAVRTEVVRSLGGFDEAMGPGALFPSSDDWDIAIRALLRGWHVYECAEVSITHHGFRRYSEGRDHARRDWVALGAVCAKPLRAGSWSTVTLPLWTLGAYAMWPPVLDLLALRRPRGITRIVSFLQGFARGLRTPVDARTLCFMPSPAPEDEPSSRNRDPGPSDSP